MKAVGILALGWQIINKQKMRGKKKREVRDDLDRSGGWERNSSVH